jgi:hypothetical protein
MGIQNPGCIMQATINHPKIKIKIRILNLFLIHFFLISEIRHGELSVETGGGLLSVRALTA